MESKFFLFVAHVYKLLHIVCFYVILLMYVMYENKTYPQQISTSQIHFGNKKSMHPGVTWRKRTMGSNSRCVA